MKKLLSVLVLGALLSSASARAADEVSVGAGVLEGGLWTTTVAEAGVGTATAAAATFATAVSAGFLVVALDAYGVPFPLCGVNGWSCTGSYPMDKNGQF